MSFIVSARASSGEVRYRRTSMLGALEQSLALLSSGLNEVAVTDPHGRRFTPAEFGRALFDDGQAPETRLVRKATTLAA